MYLCMCVFHSSTFILSVYIVYLKTFYIEDIFTVWTDGEPALRAFIQNLNRHHLTIKLSAFWSAEEVTFLDTRVYLRDGLIGTDLHVKPMDTHQYL